ncbi:hypothetical protein R1flu_010628 [Riccia fluitans]|uniref:Uncharacterized protein n=1 Tax=Riccia fluitans TaxID=41844 RepID=A0ABD1Z5I2_9MARC
MEKSTQNDEETLPDQGGTSPKRVITLIEAEVQHKEQMANTCEALRTMAQEFFGDRMDKTKLEELRQLKKFIEPSSKARIGANNLMDHYDHVMMDLEAAKVDIKLVVADLVRHLVELQEKLIGDHEAIPKTILREESSIDSTKCIFFIFELKVCSQSS